MYFIPGSRADIFLPLFLGMGSLQSRTHTYQGNRGYAPRLNVLHHTQRPATAVEADRNTRTSVAPNELRGVSGLARRVLALPASQAQSERVISTAGLIGTPARNSASSENAELLVYLRNVWGVAEKWRMSAHNK